MNSIKKSLVVVTLLALTAGTVALASLQVGPPGKGWKRVTIDCSQGWRAGAGGVYGGVPFDVSCNNGKSQATLTGASGTAYSIRMGVENGSIGADCAYSGDAPTLDEKCIEIGLSIR